MIWVTPLFLPCMAMPYGIFRKANLCVNPRRLSHFASKSVGGLANRAGPEKKPESYKDRIFHVFPQKPPLTGSSSNLVWGRFHGRNHVCQIFTAQCTLVHMRGLGIACRPSVRLSVRLSVTLVDCDHICWKSWKLIARTISPTPSLFVAKMRSTYSQGNMGKFWGD